MGRKRGRHTFIVTQPVTPGAKKRGKGGLGTETYPQVRGGVSGHEVPFYGGGVGVLPVGLPD